jgi:hypothetical protein
MKEALRKKRNSERLSELYPTFRVRVERVIATLEGNGIRPRIQDGWRSVADQQKAFDTGHSKLRYGFHNVTAPNGTPEALAVDLLDDDSPLNMSKSYFLQLAAAAEAEGLVTGIRWGVPKKKLVSAIDAAVASKDWSANVKVGWDPTHVEPRDITVAQAKAGERPK